MKIHLLKMKSVMRFCFFIVLIMSFSLMITLYLFTDKQAKADSLPSKICIDTPKDNTSLEGSNLTVSGWSLNSSGVKEVKVYLTSNINEDANIGQLRTDVNNVYPGYTGGSNSGYSCNLDISSLDTGTYTLIVTSIGNDNSVTSESMTLYKNISYKNNVEGGTEYSSTSDIPASIYYNDGTNEGTLKLQSTEVSSGEASKTISYDSGDFEFIVIDYCVWNGNNYTMNLDRQPGWIASTKQVTVNGYTFTANAVDVVEKGSHYTQYATPDMPRGGDSYPDDAWIGSGNCVNGREYETADHYFNGRYTGSTTTQDTRKYKGVYSGALLPNAKPIAKFSVSPNPSTIGTTLNISDTSKSNDNTDIIASNNLQYSNDGGSSWNSLNAIKSSTGIQYTSQLSNVGWTNSSSDGNMVGNPSNSDDVHLEAVKLSLANNDIPGMSIQYQAHVQNIGWQDWVNDGQIAGTVGQGLRIEALKIQLNNAPSNVHVYYQAYVQDIGWQDWVSDGQVIGTEGQGLPILALKVKIVKTNYTLSGLNSGNYIFREQVTNDRSGLQSDWYYQNVYIKNPPNISISPNSSGWTNNISPTITFTDNSGTGFNYKHYQVTNSTSEPSTWQNASNNTQNIAFSSSGIYYIHAEAMDNLGGYKYYCSGAYYVDLDNPSGSYSPNAQSWSNNGNLAVTFSPSDIGGSGVSNWLYRVSNDNGATWTGWLLGNLSGSINLITASNNNNTFKIQAQVYDNAGNEKEIDSGTYYIDRIAPTVTVNPTSKPWTNSNVSVGLTATDSGSGVNHIYYAWSTSNTIAPTTFTSVDVNGATATTTATQSTEGQWYLWYYSDDNTNTPNASSKLCSGVYQVDKTAPTITINPTSKPWTNSNVSVGLTATDSGSGVNHIYYAWSTSNTIAPTTFTSVDVNGATATTTATQSTEGQWYLWYYSDDNTNTPNASSKLCSGVYQVDKTAPTITINPTSKPWTNSNVSVGLTATDSGSGVNHIYYAWSTSNTIAPTPFTSVDVNGATATTTATQSTEGQWYLWYYSDDNTNTLNASSKLCSGVYQVDKTAPTGNINITMSTDLNISINASNVSDNGLSGVNHLWAIFSVPGTSQQTSTNLNNIDKSTWGLNNVNAYTLFNSEQIKVDIYAIDNAGNSDLLGSNQFDLFTLQASLQPSVSKQGQMITFDIKTTGDANSLEIDFPNEISSLDSSIINGKIIIPVAEQNYLDTTYQYYLPLQTPLTFDQNGNRLRSKYQFTVKAYRSNGKNLTSQPLTLDVQGNIYNGFRTRMR